LFTASIAATKSAGAENVLCPAAAAKLATQQTQLVGRSLNHLRSSFSTPTTVEIRINGHFTPSFVIGGEIFIDEITFRGFKLRASFAPD
jgi:hypothetical protein